MVEPIVGNPQEMAEAIAKALELIDEWRVVDRTARFQFRRDVEDYAQAANDTIYQIRDALENYTED